MSLKILPSNITVLRAVILTILISTFKLNATYLHPNLTLKEISSMPKSIEKDYYIWRFLKQKSTTASEAKKVASQIKYPNAKLKKAYYKKTKHKLPTPKKRRKRLSEKEKKALKIKREVARDIIRSKNPVEAWQKLSPDMQIFVYNNVGRSGRRKLDHTPSKEEWIRLTAQWGIDGMIRRIMREKHPKFSKALHMLPAKKNKIGYKVETDLALYLVKNGYILIASALFNDSIKKAKNRDELDRSLFWSWLTTRDKKYLSRLTRSYEVNIYTLAARDILKLRYPRIIVPKLPNSHIDQKIIQDPIEWAKIKREIRKRKKELKDLADRYASIQSVGIYSYILTKESRDKKQFFPLPYREYMKKLPIEREAMLYAIARQESKFIPSAVSSSFAIGMMQLMPFLIDHIAKQRRERVDYDEMFDPRKALIYANHHLNYLFKWLKHPLFVAYAYNAGIGYTKRMLKKRELFVKHNRFEPWLSIELIDNPQAREYGKRVLANYVIYMRLLSRGTTMLEMLKDLHIPSKTDRFRK